MKRKLPRMMRPFPEEEAHQSVPCAREFQAATGGSTRPKEDIAAEVAEGATTRKEANPKKLKRMPTRFKVKLG